VVNAAIAAFRSRLDALDSATPGDQRKVATILFAELTRANGGIASADAAEDHDPLNPLWEQLDALVVEHGGTVNRHTQSTLMALFGLPTAHENDPERAAWAALAMLHTPLGGLDPAGEEKQNFSLRIGIHTGQVIAAALDSTGELNALGDAVNLASRLRNAAVANEILISQDTYRHIRGIFDLQTLEPLPLRGKAEPVQVFRLRSARTRALRLTSSAQTGEITSLVGRGAELETLQNLYWSSLQDKTLHVVTLSGETGIGKTRLAQEFIAWHQQNAKISPSSKGASAAICLQAVSPMENSHVPFSLLRNLLAGHYQIDDSAAPQVVREILEREFRPLLRGDAIEAAHLIGHLALYDFSSSPYVQRYRENAPALRQRALHLCAKYFEALAAGQPLVIVLDDLQWADPDSLAMIDTLVKEQIKFPALLLCLARHSFFEEHPRGSLPSTAGKTHPWPHYTHLELQPLSLKEVRQLGTALLQPALPEQADQEILPELITALQEHANGNPFFISEMIRMWFEDGTLVPAQEGWKLNPELSKKELAPLLEKIPFSLSEVMQARLDSLPIPEFDLLKRAAVIGRIFWDEALQALAPHTSEDTAEIVHQLVARGLIVERSPSAIAGCQEYCFTHSLLYQVTYESVLKRLRAGYHIRAAAWLEEKARRVCSGGYTADIAAHYEKAAQFGPAAAWYERAGDCAVRQFQPEIALEFFQKALLFVPTKVIDQRVSLLRRMGDMLWWMARYSQALDTAGVQAETAQTHHQPAAWADALNRMSAIQNRIGGHTLGLGYTTQAEAIARQANALPELAAALFYRGISLYRMGNGTEAQAVAEQALELNYRLQKEESYPNAQAEIIRCLNLLGMVHQFKGNYSASWDYYQQVLEYHRVTGNPSGAIAALNNLGVNAHIRGDYSSALTHYRQALEEARYVGYRDLELVCLTNMSGALVELGEYQQAETNLRQVVESTQWGWFLLSEAKRFLAMALLGQRHRQEALEYAREAVELARKNGAREYLGRSWRILGMIASQTPSGKITLAAENSADLDPLAAKEYSARDCFKASEEIFKQSGGAGELARTWREWARYELKRGEVDLGKNLWSAARASFEKLGLDIEVQRMQNEIPD
jgi:class 3 adenylate cyclase/tetratricopeptide (TPR) repeat protein